MNLGIPELKWRYEGARLGGLDVVTSEFLVDDVEDWSKVRSPGRAERRRRQGHRQNIVIRQVPSRDVYQFEGTLFMHPQMLSELRRQVADNMSAAVDRMYSNALKGLS